MEGGGIKERNTHKNALFCTNSPSSSVRYLRYKHTLPSSSGKKQYCFEFSYKQLFPSVPRASLQIFLQPALCISPKGITAVKYNFDILATQPDHEAEFSFKESATCVYYSVFFSSQPWAIKEMLRIKYNNTQYSEEELRSHVYKVACHSHLIDKEQ